MELNLFLFQAVSIIYHRAYPILNSLRQPTDLLALLLEIRDEINDNAFSASQNVSMSV